VPRLEVVKEAQLCNSMDDAVKEIWIEEDPRRQAEQNPYLKPQSSSDPRTTSQIVSKPMYPGLAAVKGVVVWVQSEELHWECY